MMNNADFIRLAAFLGFFFLVAAWEHATPKRTLTTSKSVRWTANLTITVLGVILVRAIYPLLGAALVAGNNNSGMLNTFAMPFGLKVLLGVLLLDLAVYGQHVLFHSLPILWRFHMMHHADLDIDVTTGLRFHPLEIALSMGIKLGAIYLIGPPALAILLFEIFLNATSMFNHGNISISPGVDRILRIAVVTPDVHRVHHSVVIKETNSNFGFNFPWWDRLFGTYRSQPGAGHEQMIIGLSQFRDEKKLTLPRLLVLPFIGKPGAYPFFRNPGRKLRNNP